MPDQLRTLEDRCYGVTIPEYGGSPPAHPLVPKPGVVTVTAEVVTDWSRVMLVVKLPSGRVLAEYPIPPALIARKKANARQAIDRRCAGMRRRQQRRSRGC